jgi:hypothetical protein
MPRKCASHLLQPFPSSIARGSTSSVSEQPADVQATYSTCRLEVKMEANTPSTSTQETPSQPETEDQSTVNSSSPRAESHSFVYADSLLLLLTEAEELAKDEGISDGDHVERVIRDCRFYETQLKTKLVGRGVTKKLSRALGGLHQTTAQNFQKAIFYQKLRLAQSSSTVAGVKWSLVRNNFLRDMERQSSMMSTLLHLLDL